MIFRRRRDEEDDWDDEEDEEEEIDYVLFQGAFNDSEVDLAANARLAQVGLIPTKELITDALLRRAERIILEPKGQRTRIILYIDGVMYPGGQLSKQQALAITQMIKLLSGLDIKERGIRQRGGVKSELQDTPYHISVVCDPVAGGAERLTLNVQNAKKILETANDLNFSDDMREKIREYAARKKGLIFVCGPDYSGVTTLCRAVMRTVDVYLYSCYSLADLGGRDLPNVTPFQRKEGEDFETSIQRMQRLEADVIYINPIDGSERAKEVFAELDKAAMVCEGPAKDAVHGILQLANWVGSMDEVIKHLSLCFSGKLIRTLCEKCKEAYRPHPKLLQKIGLPPETKLLYRPRTPPDPDDPEVEEEDLEPCEACGDVGYVGRTGMYEMVELTDSLKEFLATNPPYAAIKAEIRKLGMQTTQKEGVRLVAEGKTSLEELQRVFKGR